MYPRSQAKSATESEVAAGHIHHQDPVVRGRRSGIAPRIEPLVQVANDVFCAVAASHLPLHTHIQIVGHLERPSTLLRIGPEEDLDGKQPCDSATPPSTNTNTSPEPMRLNDAVPLCESPRPQNQHRSERKQPQSPSNTRTSDRNKTQEPNSKRNHTEKRNPASDEPPPDHKWNQKAQLTHGIPNLRHHTTHLTNGTPQVTRQES